MLTKFAVQSRQSALLYGAMPEMSEMDDLVKLAQGDLPGPTNLIAPTNLPGMADLGSLSQLGEVGTQLALNLPKWQQAVIDVGLIAAELIVGGWILYALLYLLARTTSIAKYWRCFMISAFIWAVFVTCIGDQLRLLLWQAILASLFLAFLAMIVMCGVTKRQALSVSIVFMFAFGGMQHGANLLMDYHLPGRWTFAQQYRLVEEEANRPRRGIGTSLDIREILAIAIDALVTLTSKNQAELLSSDVAVGLIQLRERRMAATNREEIVANRKAYEELSAELIGTPESTGTVTVAQLREALARLPNKQASNEPVPDLDVAVSNLIANLSSSNGVASLLILGHTMAEVSRELDAMKANPALYSVAQESVDGQMDSVQAAALEAMGITGTLGRAGMSTGTTSNGAVRPAFAAGGLSTGDTNEPDMRIHPPLISSSFTSDVTIASGSDLVYVQTPKEMKITSIVSRSSGKGFVVCNGEVVSVGGITTVTSDGAIMLLKLEAIEDNRPRWSVVPRGQNEMFIPIGR